MYKYILFVLLCAMSCVGFLCTEVVGVAAPTHFTAIASGNSTILQWENSDPNFASVTIRRSAEAYPEHIDDGDPVVTEASGTTHTDAGLISGTYYYSIFAHDSAGNASEKATATVTVDTTLPTHFTATQFEEVVSLDFVMPSLEAGVNNGYVYLYISESEFVSDPLTSQQRIHMSVVPGELKHHVDMYVAVGTTYHYSLFYFDDLKGSQTKISGPVTASITVQPFENTVSLDIGAEFSPASGSALGYVRDVLVDPSGNIYVAEQNNGRVRKFSSTWQELFSLAGLTYPSGLSLDTQGNLYIAESGANARILKVKTDGSDLQVVKTVPYANTLYVDVSGDFYVSTRFGRTEKYKANGDSDASWGDNGVIGVFALAIRADGSGGLYLAMFHNGKISHVSPDGKTVTDFISNLQNPAGLDIDESGNVYTFERSGRLRKYDSNGVLLSTRTDPNRNGNGISVDSLGRIWVSNLGDIPLRVFVQDKDAFLPSMPTNINVTGEGSDVMLSWDNPTDPDFWTTTIRRSTAGYPETPTDGVAVVNNTTETTHVDEALRNGTYYYSVFAQDLDFNVSPKATATIVVQVSVPETPVLTAAREVGDQDAIRLSWVGPDAAHAFSITRSQDGGNDVSVSQNISGIVSSFLEEELADGVYVYKIYALDEAGNTSNAGISAPVTIDTTAPATPTLNAVTSANRTVLSWTIPEDTHHFVLKRGHGEGALVTVDAAISGQAESYVDKVYETGAYTYHLFAVDAFGNVSQTTPTAPVAGYARWFDAASLSVNSGEKVSLLEDQSEFGLNASGPSVSSSPTYLQNAGTGTGLGALVFSSSQSLNFPRLNDIRVVFSVFKGSGSVLGEQGINLFQRRNSGSPTSPLWTDYVGIGAFPGLPGLPGVGNFDAVIGGKTYVNGIAVNGVSSQMPTHLHNGYNLVEVSTLSPVSASGFNLAPGGNQSMGEVLIYTRALSNVEQLQVRAYLMSKWFGVVSGGTPKVTVMVSEIPAKAVVENPTIDSGEITIEEEVTETVVAPKIGISGTATLNLSNGYLSSGTEIGVNGGAKGTLVLSENAAAWRDSGDVVIGKKGEGKVVQSRGVVEIAGKIVLGQEPGSSGAYTFAGGRLTAGALELNNGGASSFDWVGGALQIPSVVGSLLNQGGTLEVVGDTPMTIDGNYSQTASGTMQFTLSGGTSVSRVGSSRLMSSPTALITTTGTISAGGGTLTITLQNFTAALNTVVTVFSPPPTGTFGTVNLPELDSGFSWDQSQLYSQGILTVVASSSDLLVGRPLNVPNPFKLSEGSMFGYSLTKSTDMELRVYRSSGNEVLRKTFVKDIHEGAKLGYNRVMLTAAMFGRELSAGIYPYLLISEGKVVGKGKFAIMPE